jgi:hypothetical protein
MKEGFVTLGINDRVYVRLTNDGLLRVAEIIGKYRYDAYKEKTSRGEHVSMSIGTFMKLFGDISGQIGDTWVHHVNTPVYFRLYDWPKSQKEAGIETLD